MTKKLLSIFLLVIAFLTSRAQITITQSALGGCSSIDTLTAHLVGDIPTDCSIGSDDVYSNPFALGFTFNFYGTNYTQVLVGANGTLCFDMTLAGAYAPWTISSVLLGNTSVLNSICGPWCDIDYADYGGTCTYSTDGVAPNRKFVVTFCKCYMFDDLECPGEYTTTQMVLYETSNIVDVFIAHKTICTNWNNGYAICGVQNAAGTAATVAPGRNYPSTWSATNEAWRFTPAAGGASYTVGTIPFAPVPYSSSTIYWYNAVTHALLGTGPTLVVAPTSSTTYEAVALGCADSSFAYVTVSGITGPHISAITGTNPTACGTNDGTIKLYGITPGQIDTMFETIDGTMVPVWTSTAAADSTITLTGLAAGVYSFYIKVGPCTSNTVTITLTSSTLAFTETSTSTTVCGKCDGTITIHGLWPGFTATVNYSQDGVPHTWSGTVAADSTVTLTGLCARYPSSLYSGIAASVGGCTTTGPDITLTSPSISDYGVSPTICGKNDGYIKLYNLPAGASAIVSYLGATGSPVSLTVAGDDTLTVPNLLAGNYTSIVAAINITNCPAPDVTLVDPPVHAYFDTTTKPGCNGDEVFVNGNSTPAGYTNTWSFGDGGLLTTTTDSGNHIYNDFPSYIGSYVIKLVYQTYGPGCKDSMSIPVNFYHPVSASFTPVQDTFCLNAMTPVVFTNTSVGTGLASLWSFGDGTTSVANSPSYNYSAAGVYETSLTVTDYLGCTASATGTVDVITLGIRTVTHDTTVCLVKPLEMIAHPYTQGVAPAMTFAWTPATNLTVYDDTITYFWGVGDYTYTISATVSSFGCTTYDVETIHSKPPIILVNVTPDNIIPYGGHIQLNADGADYYYWYPNDGTLTNNNINDPVARPLDSTTYTVVGISLYGCRDTAYVTIRVDDNMTPFIPSAFSPNNDGLNDKFHVVNLKYEKLVDMKIFDRWGVEMFRTNDPADGWDGTYKGVPQDLGTYNYVVILSQPGSIANKTYTGTLTLIR